MQKWKAAVPVKVKKWYAEKIHIHNGHRKATGLAADGVVIHHFTIQFTLHQEKFFLRVMHKNYFLSVYYKKGYMSHDRTHLDKPEAF